jgi:hypothetical protein
MNTLSDWYGNAAAEDRFTGRENNLEKACGIETRPLVHDRF